MNSLCFLSTDFERNLHTSQRLNTNQNDALEQRLSSEKILEKQESCDFSSSMFQSHTGCYHDHSNSHHSHRIDSR